MINPLNPSGDTDANPIRAKPTCPMEEKANILLMLVCAIAPKAPTIIDPPDRKTKTSCQLWAMPPNTSNRTLANIAPIANLGTIAMKAVTGVGAPS